MGKHTQRTLQLLREHGYTPGIAERWIPMKGHPAGGVRKDLFGFIDIVAMDPSGKRIIAVQSFGADFRAHMRKITTEAREDALLWLLTGNPIVLVGWRPLAQYKINGERAKRDKMTAKIHWMTTGDFYENNAELLED